MRTITHLYRYGGIELTCELEYAPGDEGQPDPESGDCCPPSAATAFLFSAKVGGIDITPLLDEELVEKIEEDAAWQQS
jgi:hypothetical protein